MKHFSAFLLLAMVVFVAAGLSGCARMQQHSNPQPTYEIPNAADSPTGKVRQTHWRKMQETLKHGNSPDAQKISNDLDAKFGA